MSGRDKLKVTYLFRSSTITVSNSFTIELKALRYSFTTIKSILPLLPF